MIEIIRRLNPSSAKARELFRFRHLVFVEHAGWELPCRDQLEMDEFDTEHAVHLVRRNEAGEVVGQLRLLPTTRPYMIQQLWPDLMGPTPLPQSPRVWEVTRLGADPRLGLLERGRVVAELVTACIEYGMRHGIVEMLAVMGEDHARKSVRGMGWSYERLGPMRTLGTESVMAARLPLNERELASVHRRTRIQSCLRPEAVPVMTPAVRVPALSV